MTKSEDGSPKQTFSETFYFSSASELDSLFCGKLLKNLKKAEDVFSVNICSRDLQFKIKSEKRDGAQRFVSFIKELESLLEKSSLKIISQREFEYLLSAFSERRENELAECFAQRIKVGNRKSDIVPRTHNQLVYAKAIREKDIVFGTGPAGTGKTYLAMALAVSGLLSGRCERIVMTRPAVEAGENLGFLPGRLEEKINPYLRPLYDALYDMIEFSEASALIERGIIEVAPLAFMRGRTLNDSFIILDEAQNTTNEQMLMLLTRIGFNSKCVIAGDPTQTDLSSRRASGLTNALRRLSHIDEIAICRFDSSDVLRHSLVEKIIDAYSEELPQHGGAI